ncbi:12905_t:CDS:2 [Gigaspora margarita]|uniref:12905_t:CDS:1 n=1 Tax=Gigaspora margarita TaxID=4874 RepID=A0ABN7W7S6_GIGMA|nr:12905_t:CDS:2 [Gigaspora margarita]
MNPTFNIQIKYLVNFAEHFYEPLVQFVVTQDPISQIMQDGKLVQLPNNNIEMFFADKLLEAINVLSSNEFEQIFNKLEYRMNKVYEHFEKWIEHGGEYAQLFANSFRFVVLKRIGLSHLQNWNKICKRTKK